MLAQIHVHLRHPSSTHAVVQSSSFFCAQVAGRTNDSAGDGTTTASILAREMIKYGMQAVSSGLNPIPIKKGIDKTVAFLEKELRNRAQPVSSRNEIKAVATISSGNDDDIGELIADALDKVGKDGVLTIETSSGLVTTVDVTEGMEIDRGYISPQFITNQERMLVEFENARVLVTDHKIEDMKTLLPLLDQACRLQL
jgi:chaperonin GroEL (HSP60 family)